MNPGECGHGGSAAAWILGTLNREEAERFAEHLEGCQACQAEVARLREAADAMADAVPSAAPPPGLRVRLMSAVRQEAELFRAAAGEPGSPSAAPSRSRRRRVAAVAVAGASLAAGVLLGGALSGERTVSARTIAGELRDVGEAPGSRAEVVVRGDDARLVLSDVEPPSEGRIYQAWLERSPNMPAPTGALFSIGPTGDASVVLPALRGAERVIVTSEPFRSSPSPTTPPVVIVRLPGS